MKPKKEHWARVENLFHQLADADVKEKQETLEKLRTEDLPTYELLKTLLEADVSPNRIFANDPKELLGEWTNEEALIGRQIGAFRLDELVGQGAMGSVYRASRADGQFEQTVAIKVLKSHMAAGTHRELFDRERQILARLNHPGIARLYDGGFNEDGRPYFTMEWISGESLTDYIRKNTCSLERRLELFRQVCVAVRHAHQSLIAHLDLKPANSIVTEDGQVKLLDFGVSRLFEDATAQQSNFTLAYAAPEQIRRESANAVSDIYSLGVILREILTLQHPFKTSFADVHRLKKQILSGTPDPDPTGIPTDLLLMSKKAMEMEPADRYGSVDEMISDLDAYRNDYPVSVRRNDVQYVARKYFRRHRTVLTSVFIAVLMLLSTGAFYTRQLQEQRNIARSEAMKSNQITGLLTDVFMAADPNVGGADTITAVNLLDQGAMNLNKNLADDPQMLADMQLRLANIYLNLGQYDKGQQLAGEAYSHLLSAPGSSPDIFALVDEVLGNSFYYKGQLDSAAICASRGLKRLKDEESVTEQKVSLQVLLANVYYDQGQLMPADSLYKLCYENYQQLLEAPHTDLAFMLNMIGSTSRDLGDLETAEDFFMQSLGMKKELFEEPHLEIAYTYNYLGSLNQSKRDFETALDYITQSYEQRKAILGTYHVETMASMANMARTYNLMERYGEAAELYGQTLEIVDSLFGKSHHYYAGLIGSQSVSYLEMGEYQKARAGFTESLALYRELNPGNLIRQVSAVIKLGDLALLENDPLQAREYYEEALGMRMKALPEGHFQIAQSQQTLGKCLLDLGDYPTAIVYLESALETFRSNPDTDNEKLNTLNTSLALAYEAINDMEKAGYYQSLLTSGE